MQLNLELKKLPHNFLDMYYQYLKINKNKRKKPKAGQLSTLCKLLKIAIGVGVLALPNGFKRVNLFGGFLVLILSGLLQYYSWDLLVQVIENTSKIDSDCESNIPSQQDNQLEAQSDQIGHNESTQIGNDANIIDDVDISQTESNNNPLTFKKGIIKYKDVNLISAFKIVVPENKKMIIMVQIITFLLFFGNAVGLIMFFNQTLHAFGNEINPQSKYQFPVSIGTIIVIMMFSLLKKLEDLRKLTRTGSYLLFIAIYFFISISLLQIQQDYQNNITPQIEYGINYKQIPYFFGVAIFSYDVNGMFTEIREEMKNPQYFRRNMKIQMIICFCVYSTFGGLCYLAYGQQTNSLITLNLDSTISQMGFVAKYSFLILQLFYALSMILNVILENIVSLKLIEAIPHILFNFKQQFFPLYIKLLIRFIYVTVCVVSAVYIQSFSNIITFLGSTTSVILGFIVPNYLYGKLFPQKKITIKIFNYIVVILGIIGGILGASQSFQG